MIGLLMFGCRPRHRSGPCGNQQSFAVLAITKKRIDVTNAFKAIRMAQGAVPFQLQRFQAKRSPVRVKKTRKTKQ
jgi:hypothetical protein